MIDESSPTNSDFLNMTCGKAVQERWWVLLLQESLLSHLDLIASDAGFSQSTLEYLRALSGRRKDEASQLDVQRESLTVRTVRRS